MKYSLKVPWPRSEVVTSDGFVFIRILVSDYKPLGSPRAYNSFVSRLACPWLPIVRSQRFETRSQGRKSFNKNE